VGRLDDRVAIITGGASGLGRAAAVRFVAEGARVSLWDVDTSRGEALAAELGDAATFHPVDVSDAPAVDAAVTAVVDRHGRLDILLNNAGITRDATLLKMSPGDFDRVIDVNLRGVFQVGQSVARVMVAAGSGVIVNTSSVVGIHGNFGQSNYAATKAGVIGMTKVWARELGPKGVRVNAIAPGFIATEMVTAIPEKILDMMRERAPLGRLGRPEEVADAYLFLASDESSYVNGAVLSVDGGVIT